MGGGGGCGLGVEGGGEEIRTTDSHYRFAKHVTHIRDNGSPLDPYLGAEILQIGPLPGGTNPSN